MKIGVTGAAGYLGSYLLWWWSFAPDQPSEVVAVDRLDYTGIGWGNVLWKTTEDWEFIPLPVTSKEALDALNDCRFVIHLAADVGEAACDRRPDYWNNNVATTAALAHHFGSRLILASTCSNYGVSEGMVKEDAQLQPLSGYARSKVEAEKIVLEKGGMVLRFGTLLGWSPRPRFDLLPNEFVYNALRGIQNSVYKPEAWRPWLTLQDAAQAFDRILEKGLRNRVYNVVSRNATKLEIAEIARKAFNGHYAVNDYRPDDRNYRVDASAFARDYQWRPINSLEFAMRGLWDWVSVAGPFADAKEFRNA